MEFKAEYYAYMHCKQMLDNKMSKAYAFLWEHCSKGMQSKIEAQSNFSLDVKGNLIELLKSNQTACSKLSRASVQNVDYTQRIAYIN
jgi:hypothetical protein